MVVNLHPKEQLKETRVLFPEEAIEFLRFAHNDKKMLHLAERLGGDFQLTVNRTSLSGPDGLALPALEPLTASFFEITVPND